MKNQITVKATFMHSNAAKYEKMLKDGMSIDSEVVFKANGAFIEAQVNGEAIGNVEGSFDIPKVYTAMITGLGSDPMTFVIEVEEAGGSASSSEYDSLKEAILKKGFHVDDIDRRIDYMNEEGFTPEVIAFVLEWLALYGDPSINFIVDGNNPIYRRVNDKESPVSKMIRAAATQGCQILSGQKSTGKNVAAHTVAMLLAMREYRVQFQRDMGIDDVFGGKGTDNSASAELSPELAQAHMLYSKDPEAYASYAEDASRFEYLKAKSASISIVQNRSDVIEWATSVDEDGNEKQFPGGVMMFDEINMSHANLLQSIMNPLTDGDKTLVIPGVGRIKLHPACILFAGMNPGYEGTMQLNSATKSRSGFILFEDADSIVPQLKANFANSKALAKHFDACNRVYRDFKAAAEQSPPRVSNDCLNIRGFVNALKQVERFPKSTTLADEIMTWVVNGVDDPDERLVLTGMVNDKVNF